MATIKLQDGKVVLKGGKASCECCTTCAGCTSISISSGSSSPPQDVTTCFSGGAVVTLTATNVDGLSLGWSMTATAKFIRGKGSDPYSFPSTTVTVPRCLNPDCEPQDYIKIVSIPEGVSGEITFKFSLSGSDCCDSFSFSLECNAAP